MNHTYLAVVILAPPAGYGLARALEDWRARRRPAPAVDLAKLRHPSRPRP